MHDVIDIHTHVAPAEFPAYAGTNAKVSWPHMESGCDAHHRNLIIDGRLFRSIGDDAWEIGRRIDAMAAAGVTRQVLSPMPELLSYWIPAEDALRLARHVNGAIADMVGQAPDHFTALGTVPLQDPVLAARELEALMRTGLFKGVEIGANINGTVIGDAKFEAFFATAESLGAAIFVHAQRPIGADKIIGPPVLANLVAHPCDVSFAIASVITSGLLERRPRLRLAFSHGGGAFGLVLPRLEHGWRHIPALRELMKRSPSEQARTLYYDTVTYDEGALRYLIERFGETQLCIGTDYPFGPERMAPIEPLAQFSNTRRALLYAQNARRFLGEPDKTDSPSAIR